MFKKILIIIVLLIAVFLVYVAKQPPGMFIAREVVIRALPEAIFPHINSSQRSNEWMPWQEVDPKVQMTHSGPEEGVGSTSSWQSSGQMGTGKAEIVESIANQSVKTQLTYTKPMQMSQLAEISLKPTGAGTVVRWSVTGRNSYIGRMFTVFMNMDEMVGGQFEKGLAKLKSKVEGGAGVQN